ncbi:hypothetical protein SAMN02745136_04672 [Anaerocolumna jejuensis DSM 15929]|uniref:Uncharacterized protein n=1 Tax=Anaerocolumna jejuensis DSM 15929 TaxID=1121322 RepID=A0A1M6ZUJ8_9FIRM|nr:hypothetical protein [Anaerocolumna jejuensis]SHL34168.1 hypothetical protein SAMN02745136_04672 [Anaerocolumna jejuensis DSM 15929]
MSSSVSLNVKLDSNKLFNCKEVINLLLKFGWNIHKDGKITFLPLKDDDMYDWTTSNITLGEFIKLVDEKDYAKEIVGVELYWENTDIGGHLLMFNKSDFSFALNIHTKYIGEKDKIPDFNWYVERIIPYLNLEYHVMEYEFEFIY